MSDDRDRDGTAGETPDHADATEPVEAGTAGYELDEDAGEGETRPRATVDHARAARPDSAQEASDGTTETPAGEVPAPTGDTARGASRDDESLGDVASAAAVATGARTARSVDRPDEVPTPAPTTSRTVLWIVAGVLALLVVGAVVGAVVTGNAGAPEAEGTAPSPSASGDATPGAASSPAASPDATPTDTATVPPEQNSQIAPELAPVDPAEAATGDDGVVVQLARIESVNGEGNMPGEISGPAVRITVELQNDSPAAVDLNSVVVNAYTGADRAPANAIQEPGGSPLSGTLAVGKRATGVYLFSVPVASRDDVLVGVDYRAGSSTVTFRGPVG